MHAVADRQYMRGNDTDEATSFSRIHAKWLDRARAGSFENKCIIKLYKAPLNAPKSSRVGVLGNADG